MAYGLPFGPDTGQAGIRALVTVASLKTSEGSGKTQTQCLFLQTEKGSCLYSTGKTVSAGSAASGAVGGWLKGKTGAKGCRETPVGQRDQWPSSVAESKANNVRVRSGRRWRKSCKAASTEKKDVKREVQQIWREDPGAEISLDERQEEEHNGGVERNQFPSLLHIRRIRQEKEEALQNISCCHDISPSGCIHCGRKAQRSDASTRSTSNRQNSDKHPRRREGEEQRVIYELESSDFQAFSADHDLEINKCQPESYRNSDITKFADAKREEELNTRNNGYSGKEDTDTEFMNALTNNSPEQLREDFALSCNTRENLVNEKRTEEGMMHLDVTEENEKITQISTDLLVVSNCSEDVPVFNRPLCIRAEFSPNHIPLEGSIYNVVSKSLLQSDKESGKQYLRKCKQGIAEHQIGGKQELDMNKFDQQEQNSASVQDNTVTKGTEPLLFFGRNENSLHEDDFIEATLKAERTVTATNSCNFSTTACSGKVHQGEIALEEKEDNLPEGNIVHREIPEKVGVDGVIWRGRTPHRLNVDGGKRNDVGGYTIYGIQEDNSKEVPENCALQDNWKLPVSADECRTNEETPDTCGQTSRNKVEANSEISANVSDAAYADLSTSLTLWANPAHFLPLLESMRTDLPLLEVKKEEEGEQVGLLLSEGSQEGNSRQRRDLEELSEDKRGYTVVSKKECNNEEEEEEDEFGVFMQAEGESAWNEGLTMPALVPCGSRESVGECYFSLWFNCKVEPLLMFLFPLATTFNGCLFILLPNHLSPFY